MIVSNYDPIFDYMHDELHKAALSQAPPTGAKAAKKNAQKHGVTADLEPKSVCEWYRVIVGDPNDTLPLMETSNYMQRLALDLAKTEVRLRRVLQTIAEFDEGRDPLFEERANLLHDYALYLDLGSKRSFDKWTRDGFKLLLRAVKMDLRMVDRQINKRTRLLDRYKREAVSKQRKAQKVWCDQFKRD
ncbi:hypothetical protein GN278_10700 [Rhodobacteraceae bacterium Araon29]